MIPISGGLRILITTILLSVFCKTVQAQTPCGVTVLPEEYNQAVKNYEKWVAAKKTARSQALGTYTLRSIPVKFYVGSSKSQVIMNERIAITMAYLNKIFAPINYQFYIQSSSGVFYDATRRDDAGLLVRSSQGGEEPHFHELAGYSTNALNIFIFDDLKGSGGDPPGGYAFTSPGRLGYKVNNNFVAIKNSSLSNNLSTFYNNYYLISVAHEIGHFLGMFHTFQNTLQKERDGTIISPPNCSSVANNDLIDDTPLDPYEYTNNYEITNQCEFIGKNSLLCGITFSSMRPLMNNIMSYWPSLGATCINTNNLDYGVNFTENQYQQIRELAETNIFNNSNGYKLNEPGITAIPSISLDENTATKVITWPSVANSVGFIIERATSQTGPFLPIGGTANNKYTDLPPSSSVVYYYRVRCSNSTNYSNTIATGCQATNETVVLYNNSYQVKTKDPWWKSYLAKAVKWNLVDKNKSGTVNLGEAAKSVILVAKSIWPAKYTMLPKPCYDQSEYAAYVLEMKRLGIVGGTATPNDPVSLDILSDMVYQVILNAGANLGEVSALPTRFIRNNIRFSGSVKAKNLANVATIRFMGLNSKSQPIPTAEYMLDTRTTVNRGVFVRVLTGAYETKNIHVNGQLRQARVAATLAASDIDDIATIGYKQEFEDDVPDGAPTLQLNGASEQIQSGAQWWIEVADGLLGSSPVQFYWTVEGALQGARLDPYDGYPNYKRIYFTAPTVQTETMVNMVIYGVTNDGRATEIYKEFKVVPIPNSGCLSLLTPSLSFDRVVGSFRDARVCTFTNGSTNSTANLTFRFTGPNASSFSGSVTSTNLGPNQTASIDIYCEAGTIGTYTATLEITQTGLNGCPQKITVPLLANVVTTTPEPGLSWINPQEGVTFYSGGVPNHVATNTGSTYMEYSLDNTGWLPVSKDCYASASDITFPTGAFALNARLRVRKRDCSIGGTGSGNYVYSPSFKLIHNPNLNINLSSPNGKETLTGGQLCEIRWTGSSTAAVTLQFSTDGGTTFPNTIAMGLSASAGRYSWVVPIRQGYESNVKVKISSGQFSDISDASFTVRPPMYINPTIRQGCDNKGIIVINDGGGTFPHSYLITPGNYTTNEVRGLEPGVYTIKVTDQTGESIQTTVTIPTYTAYDFSYEKTDASCGGRNGKIKITSFSAGFIPERITYYRDGTYMGTFTGELTDLEAGRYGINVFNAYDNGTGCAIYKIIDINPDQNFAVTSTVTDASCGQSDGVISLSATGPATYRWRDGATTSSVSNLPQGTHFVGVRNGATGCELTLSFDVGQKPTFNVSAAQIMNNIVQNQMAIIKDTLFFIKPNSLSLLAYKARDLSFLVEQPISLNYNPYAQLAEIHQKYGMPPEFYPARSRIGIVVKEPNTSNILVANYNLLTGSINGQQTLTTNNIQFFGFSGDLGGDIVALNTNSSISAINSQGTSTVNGCFSHLQTTNDWFTYVYGIESCSNRVQLLGYDTQLRSMRTFITSGAPVRAYGNYGFPDAMVTIANNAYRLEVFKSDGMPDYSAPFPTELSIAADLANEFTGNGNYVFIPNRAGKVAVFSRVRKAFIQALNLGMVVEKVGYDYGSNRFYFLSGNTLKYITVVEPNLSVSYVKTDVGCSQTGSISLTVTGGGTPTFAWSNGATTKNLTNLSVGTYTVTITPSDGGCPLKKSIKIENIGVIPLASISVTSGQTSFCAGENLQLVANQGTGLTYQWQKDGIDLNGAAQQTYYATVSGVYRVKIKNGTGCEALSSSLTLTQKTSPAATITALSSTTFCEGGSVGLRTNSATDQTSIWLKDGFVLQGQNTVDITVSTGGEYQVINTLNGCSTISTSTVVRIQAISPTATLTGSATITSGQVATLTATVTGSNPWSLTLSSGQVFITIVTSPFTFTVSPTTTTTYSLSGVSNSCGIGTVSGIATVVVNVTVACGSPIISIKTGNWNDASVWSCNRIPLSTDAVQVSAGHIVTIQASVTAYALRVQQVGRLVFITGAQLRLGTNSSVVPVAGLIMYYPFDGTVNDASGNNRNGTANGGLTYTTDRTGIANKAANFDGTSTWIDTPYSQSALSEFTVSVWVKTDLGIVSGVNPSAIIHNRNTGSPTSITLDYDRFDGAWEFGVDASSTKICQRVVSTNTNTWRHIVGVWKGVGAGIASGQFKLYINGVLQTTTQVAVGSSSNPITTSGTMKIAYHQAWSTYFRGSLDDLRIYNRALVDSEVQALANQ